MVAPGKVSVKVQVKAFPMKEMSAAARDFLGQNADLKKQFEKPFEWEKKVEADARKHPKKDLDEEMFSVARYGLQLFANAVNEVAKAKSPDIKKEGKKLEKLFKEVCKANEDNCEKKLEDILSGKEDNKKALKGGGAALDKIDKIDLKGGFDKPRSEAIKVLSTLEAALKGNGDKERAKATALKAIEKVADDFSGDAGDAVGAVDFLLKTARSIKNDKKADTALVEFGKKVMKDESLFEQLLDQSDKFMGVLGDTFEALEKGEVEPEFVRKQGQELAKMTGLDTSAQKVLDLVKKLKPEFDKIKKSLA